MHRLRSLVLLFATVLTPAVASAQLVYNNGMPAPPPGGGIGINIGYAADDFSLTSGTTITRARFWGFTSRFTGTGDAVQGNLNWRIYASASSGGPDDSSVLLSGVAAPTAVDQGILALGPLAGDYTQRQYDFSLNAVLGAGTYWFALRNIATAPYNGAGQFFWNTTNSATGASSLFKTSVNPDATWGSNSSTRFDLAFQLFNDTPPLNPPSNNPSANVPTSTVPEPSTYLLMASGLAGLFLVARRRNRSC